MNLLHKKRQAFRQNIRSKSIQQIFYRKRQQILLQLRGSVQCKNHEKFYQISFQKLNQFSLTQVQRVINSKHFKSFIQLIVTYPKQFSLDIQTKLYYKIMSQDYFDRLQRMELVSRLIARKDFSMNQFLQSNLNCIRLVQQLLSVVHNNDNSKNEVIIFNAQNPINEYKFEKKKNLQSLVCYSLLKLWQLKPKYKYFLLIQKYYKSILQKVFNIFGLSLIAQLSYQKLLKPSYEIIKKLLKLDINEYDQQRLFRMIEIKKNFILHLNIRNSETHQRQIIFDYIEWIKRQIDIILSQTVNISLRYQIQNVYSFQIKYSLIYLLFITLNKLFQINQLEKQLYSIEEVVIMNEEIFYQKENHITIKFLMQQGRNSIDLFHQNNIFNTLCYYISFLEISDLNKQQFLTEQEMNEIQKNFKGNQLNWFATFN